uniref:Putative secreted peptide n=1 Tax=Anopheles braziliensis TaxID=58242 RepID=A0A2M3ZPF2_9DIPT
MKTVRIFLICSSLTFFEQIHAAPCFGSIRASMIVVKGEGNFCEDSASAAYSFSRQSFTSSQYAFCSTSCCSCLVIASASSRTFRMLFLRIESRWSAASSTTMYSHIFWYSSSDGRFRLPFLTLSSKCSSSFHRVCAESLLLVEPPCNEDESWVVF